MRQRGWKIACVQDEKRSSHTCREKSKVLNACSRSISWLTAATTATIPPATSRTMKQVVQPIASNTVAITRLAKATTHEICELVSEKACTGFTKETVAERA